MKLFKHYNKWFLKIIALLLTLGCISIFFTFRFLFSDELHEQLQFQKKQLLSNNYTYINPLNQLPIEGIFSEIVNAKGTETTNETEYYDKVEDEKMPFIEMVFYKPYKSNFIKFTVRKSTMELEDLLYTLIVSIIIVFILFTVILYYLNRSISESLFAPFFNTIESIKQNQTFANEPLQLPETKIEEFTLLNKTLNKFDNDLRNDYKKVAQFTDNASHEMQTPIAVISNRIENILESSNADKSTKRELADIFETMQQMKKTNEILLLISRLESKSFKNEIESNLKQTLISKIEFYTQFGLLQNLDVQLILSSDFIVKMNADLAKILIDNLLNNAIKHNIPEGFIKLNTTQTTITIENSGLPLNKPAIEMFNRFERNNVAIHGSGLGLSIVQEICNLYNLKIEYSESNNIHIVKISK
jgi:signal transduction histidine kinase